MWIRCHPHALQDIYFKKRTGFSQPLSRLLSTPRTPLPRTFASAWWNSPAPAQPLANRTWEAFTRGPEAPATILPGLKPLLPVG